MVPKHIHACIVAPQFASIRADTCRHAQTYSHAQTEMCKDIIAYTHMHTYTDIHTCIHVHNYARVRTHVQASADAPCCTCAQSYARPRIPTRTQAQTQATNTLHVMCTRHKHWRVHEGIYWRTVYNAYFVQNPSYAIRPLKSSECSISHLWFFRHCKQVLDMCANSPFIVTTSTWSVVNHCPDKAHIYFELPNTIRTLAEY